MRVSYTNNPRVLKHRCTDAVQYYRLSYGTRFRGGTVSQIDVLIITALPEEYEAAREAGLHGYASNPGITAWEDRDRETTTPYIVGNYVAAGGAHMSVALARPTRMASNATS